MKSRYSEVLGPEIVLFTRHARTDWSVQDLTMGRRDIPLNATGIVEATTAANSLKIPGISWIVSSPLQRCRQTAEIFAKSNDAPLSIDNAWSERFWGPYEGQPKRTRPTLSLSPDIESWESFTSRVLQGLSRLSTSSIGMIVSHSGVFHVLKEIGYSPSEGIDRAPYARPIFLSRQ